VCGALASAFTLGGFVLLAAGHATGLAVGALVTGALLAGGAAVYHLAAGRLRKVSILRLLGK
jgi:hypothetical protein